MIAQPTSRKLASSGITNTVSFGIKEDGFAHIFNVLRNQLYSNKYMAVLREYAVNGVDAHIEAGCPERPIEVSLPTQLNPNLKIRDYGSALTDTDIQDIYAFYGESTKRNTNSQTGMLGIGSKSAFAYGDNFVINSFVDGEKHTYNAFIDPSQVGQIAKLGVEDTDEENGIEIVIPTKEEDVNTFTETASEIFQWFKVRPIIKGQPVEFDDRTVLYEGDGWKWRKSTSSGYGYHSRHGSGEAIAVIKNSIVSLQFPNREKILTGLAETRGIPSIEQMHDLKVELLREMSQSGQVQRFQKQVVLPGGSIVDAEIVRVGVFNAITENFFLQFVPDTQSLQVLARQPARRYQSMAEDLFALDAGYTTMAVDPSRGQILSLLIQAPGLGERINQGGLVGYFIIFIGLIGLLMSLWRLFILRQDGQAINEQLTTETISRDNALGRILSVHSEHDAMETEALELKIDEAILKEVPKLEKYHSIIKVFAAVAPLLGLLGTVIGMIVTFQALTLFGTGDPKLMAGGISQALVTTMLGLIVAIPLVFLHSVLTSWSGTLIEVLEEQSAGLIARHAERPNR